MIFFSLFPIIQYILRLKQGTGRGWQWRMCKMVLLRKEPWLPKTKPLQITNPLPPRLTLLHGVIYYGRVCMVWMFISFVLNTHIKENQANTKIKI